MNTMVVTDSVAPRQNDITLPDSVMNVMPTATQPMNDMVVSSENMLVVVRNPGVAMAAATSASTAATRIASRLRLRRDAAGWRRAAIPSEQAGRHAGVPAALMRPTPHRADG